MRVRFPARPEYVTAARHAVRRFAEDSSLATEVIDDLVLAVSEACSNVVVHAYQGAGEGAFELCATVDAETVHVTVRDWGLGMVPRSDSPGLGLGLPLISRLSSSVEIRSADGGGSELQMTVPARPGGHNGGHPAMRSAA